MYRAHEQPAPWNECITKSGSALKVSMDHKRDAMRLSMDIADLISVIFHPHGNSDDYESQNKSHWSDSEEGIQTPPGTPLPKPCTDRSFAGGRQASAARKQRKDGFVSAYYPYIASRKKAEVEEVVEVVFEKEKLEVVRDELDDVYEADLSEDTFENEKAKVARMATRPYLDYLCKTYPLPAMRGPRWWNAVRYQLFSTYRILFIVVLGTNLAVIFLVAPLRNFEYPRAATAFAANLLAAIIIRHEHFVNLLFHTALSLPHRAPLCIRKYAAKVYCYGGVHSGCGAAVLAWYMLFLVLAVRHFKASRGIEIAFTSSSTLMLVLLCVMVFMSHPTIRVNVHDAWELSHRYAGWRAIAIAWVQVFLIIAAETQYTTESGELAYWRFGKTLSNTPAFYMLLASTILIIYPWLRTRKRNFTVEALSSHAVRLRSSRIAPVGSAVRLADAPLVECHAFAAIPNADGEKGYALIVSNAGDWTSKFIKGLDESKVQRLWVRGTPTIGVMRIALLFQPVVIVTTGSGIGPCLSFLQTHPTWPVRVIWSARHPIETYGLQIVETVRKADKDAIIIDTKSTGYPDLPTIAYSQYLKFSAEAVVIINNQSVTRDVVYKLETARVATFGVIFDS